MLFHPRPSLIRTPQGLGLAVATEVPTPCYVAGSLQPGLPDGQVALPEIAYFKAEIRHAGDRICPDVLTEVVQTYAPLKLGADKIGLVVFAMVDGEVRGAGAMSLDVFNEELAFVATPDSPAPILGSVRVWATRGCFSPHWMLHVQATAVVSTPVHTLALEPLLSGFNPTIRRFGLKVIAPKGEAITMTGLKTAYFEERFDERLREVTVEGGGTSVTVPILKVDAPFLGFLEPKLRAATAAV